MLRFLLSYQQFVINYNIPEVFHLRFSKLTLFNPWNISSILSAIAVPDVIIFDTWWHFYSRPKQHQSKPIQTFLLYYKIH